MIKIDFHGSTHGHFLEYISNVYIMQTARSSQSIFKPPTMSAHAPDRHYLDNRLIECGHYSNPLSNLKLEDHDQIIRIVIDQQNDNMFFIALTNLMYKAGDVGIKKQLLYIPETIRNNHAQHRNNWYSKFNERDAFANHYVKWISLPTPYFEFCFENFFSFNKFCKELNRLAQFLDQTFLPDVSLYEIWLDFINYNQGWQSYIKCDQLLSEVFSGTNSKIDCTPIEQGWINYNLSKICRLYSGVLFESNLYPGNTKILNNIVNEHISSLR